MIYHFHTCGFAGNNTPFFFKAALSRTDSFFTALALTSTSVLPCKVAFLSEVGGPLSSWYLLCNIWAQLFACWTAEIFATCQCLSILNIWTVNCKLKGTRIVFFSTFDTSLMLGIPYHEFLSSTIIKKKHLRQNEKFFCISWQVLKKLSFLHCFDEQEGLGFVCIYIFRHTEIFENIHICACHGKVFWEQLLYEV